MHRKLDRKFHGTEDGRTGPLVGRLQSFPPLQSLVIGAFGEASQDIHSLVDYLTESRERYVAQSSGHAPSSRERGQIRRKLSTSFIRAISMCTLNRVSNVGPVSKAASKRREWALREESNMRLERRSYWNAFLTGVGGRQGGIKFFPG